MTKVFTHIAIAVVCTIVGVSIWLYVNNIIFPAEPVPFEPEPQLLRSTDVLETKAMQEDFAYLLRTIEDVHPDPYGRIGEDAWDEKEAALWDAFSKPLSAAAYYAALASLVSSVGDAHTTLLFEESDKGLPLLFAWVEEGLVIAEDHGQFRMGDRVMKIADRTPDEILQELDELVSSENRYWVRNESRRHLRRRAVLELLDLVQDDAVVFAVEREGDTLEITARFEAELPGRQERSEGLLAARHAWSIDHEGGVGVFELRVCVDDEVFRKDVGEFFAEVNRHGIGTIVIDLRENVGGQSRVVEAFLRHLPIDSYRTYGSTIRYSEQAAERIGMRRTRGTSTFSPSTRRITTVDEPFTGTVFVLTGNQTFSAGNWIAVVFYDNDLATIVGEPTGNAPSSFGDMITFQLPNTRFVLGVSYKHFTRPDPSNDPQDALYPHVRVSRTRTDLVNDVDPVMSYVVNAPERASKSWEGDG